LAFKEVILTSQSQSQAQQAVATVDPVLVVLGIDADNKPHASKFRVADKDIVLRAAGLMAYRVLRLSADDVGKLAAPLPDGKVFATGRGFVPFVRRELYDKLAALLGTAAELKVPVTAQAGSNKGADKPTDAKQAASVSKPKAAPAQPAAALGSPWSDIKVGTTVLARDDDNESWFEATVASIADDDPNVLRLRWRDYPLDRVNQPGSPAPCVGT